MGNEEFSQVLDIQEKLYEEINEVEEAGKEIQEERFKKNDIFEGYVLETLRRHPSGPFILPCSIVEDTKLDGYVIPKNVMVNFTVADMVWNPNVWEDPMEFKPERFLTNNGDQDVTNFDLKCVREVGMMPFGAGRRVCPAITMALLHHEYYVANLIRDFK